MRFLLPLTLLAFFACEPYQPKPVMTPAPEPSAPALAPALASAPAPALSSSASIPVRAVDPNALPLSGPVLFEPASDHLRPDSTPALKALVEYLKLHNEFTLVRVEDHIDEPSLSDAAAMSLSQRRAIVAARKVVSLGADCQRLLPVGFGNVDATKGVAFVVAANRGKTLGPVAGGGQIAGDPCR